MQKAVSCASLEHSLGIVQVAAVHVSMYLPNSLSKVNLKKLSPFYCCLTAHFPSCSSCPIPPSCATQGALQVVGAQRLVEGNGSLEIPTASPTFGLKARGFKKIKIQPLFPPAVCVERPEGVTPVLQLLLLGAVLEEGVLGGNQGGLELVWPRPLPWHHLSQGLEGLASSGLHSHLKSSIFFEMV